MLYLFVQNFLYHPRLNALYATVFDLMLYFRNTTLTILVHSTVKYAVLQVL